MAAADLGAGCTESGTGRSLGDYLRGQAPSAVILETCAEAFQVADLARAAGHKPIVAAATLVRSLGVGARRVKTDRPDAQILSEVSSRVDLSSVHIPSPEARRYKTVCSMREGLVCSRTLLINTVRGWLRAQGIRIRSGQAETFATRVYEKLTEVPRFLEGAQGEVGRFESAHKVEAYLGLGPGENSSGERQRRTSITKAGAPGLRYALIQAAWCTRRARGHHPMVATQVPGDRRLLRAVDDDEVLAEGPPHLRSEPDRARAVVRRRDREARLEDLAGDAALR